MLNTLKSCNLCPRNCGTDRTVSLGFCLAPQNPTVARAALHFWEEPCISGTQGSGTVFFSGCNLKCVYCQNIEISKKAFGKEVSLQRLGEIFLELQEMGAHNINLVSPTPYVPQIIEAIDMIRDRIHIPLVYNTGGYETEDTIGMLDGYIDIFLTDIKYYRSKLSETYSKAEDYFTHSISAARKMIDQVGKPKFDKAGMLKSGVIIRHLCLPGQREDSIRVLDEIKSNLQDDGFILSLMSQYTPIDGLSEDYPELCRKITTFEYSKVVDHAITLGLDKGYTQNRQSAKKDFTPPFDLTGI